MAELSEIRTDQAEKLAQGFRLLVSATQDALRASREEQAAQLNQVQQQVEKRLEAIQKSNEERLEQMRRTVDEKLHETLEKRLGESFSLVAQRLEQVQKGLGEMQSLAQDVGGLKRALTNVKTRGVLGEAQLGALLEQFLSAGQYATNVKIKPRSAEVVEFAVKLPGPEEGGTVWLPIDAKFPLEDYQRLMEAYEVGDLAAVETAGRALEVRLLGQARDIRDKYIAPPYSTDFALLFLPFEGLYAEALRRPGLLERLQRECKVTFVGPTTLTAFLNSLQVGFKTLAISKQSGEVWRVLGQVKTEFGKFGESLAVVQKKLDEASSKLGEVSKGKERMEKRLAGVEALPETEAQGTLPGPYREE
jgi:DNA recombination protein RmuC